MVKRSLICTLVLVVLYSLYVHFFNVKPVVQYTLQNNLIRAEKYMYDDSVRSANLLIGTSMSAKINQDKLPKNVYLLAGAGFSIYDGMALIKASGRHPKYVFLEVNSILVAERSDYIKFLFNMPDYYRKKYLVSMRDGYQPAGQFYSSTAVHTAPRIQWFTHYFFNPIIQMFHKGKVIPVDTKDFYAGAKMRSNIDTNMIKAAFVQLKAKVNDLEKGGTKVCFYLLPNDPEVYYSYAPRKIRELFPRYFPASAYTYVPPPNIYEYHTTDQIHMDDTSCAKFTKYIAGKIATVIKN